MRRNYMREAIASLLVKIGLFMIKMAVKLKPKSEIEKLSAIIEKASKTISDVFDDKNNVYDKYIEERIKDVEEKHVCCGRCKKDKKSPVASQNKVEDSPKDAATEKVAEKKKGAAKPKRVRKTKKTTKKAKAKKE